MSEQTPCVFISYSHDGEAHRSRVLELAQRLRKDGVPTLLDRFVPNQSPPEGWPRWMLDGLDKATHVLCVCTETYYRRFRGHEVPSVGKGVDWEGAIITNELYDARSVSQKFIPILFDRRDEQFIPEPLRGQTFYILNSESIYDSLYNAILDQGGIEPHPVGVLRRKQRPTAAPSTFDHESADTRAAALAGPSITSGHTTQIATTQLSRHASRVLFGRDAELELLDAAWADSKTHIQTLIAWGGAGKTSLVFHWVQTRFATQNWPGVVRYFDWSFYSQGTGESRQTSADLFINKALEFFGDPEPTAGSGTERGERLAGLVRQQRTLLVLDGIEPLQYPPGDPQAGRLKDPGLETLLKALAFSNPGLLLVTSRESLTDIESFATAAEKKLDRLPVAAGVQLLRHLHVYSAEG